MTHSAKQHCNSLKLHQVIKIKCPEKPKRKFIPQKRRAYMTWWLLQERYHPFPFRTRPWNFLAQMVLCLKAWESMSSPSLISPPFLFLNQFCGHLLRQLVTRSIMYHIGTLISLRSRFLVSALHKYGLTTQIFIIYLFPASGFFRQTIPAIAGSWFHPVFQFRKWWLLFCNSGWHHAQCPPRAAQSAEYFPPVR